MYVVQYVKSEMCKRVALVEVMDIEDITLVDEGSGLHVVHIGDVLDHFGNDT